MVETMIFFVLGYRDCMFLVDIKTGYIPYVEDSVYDHRPAYRYAMQKAQEEEKSRMTALGLCKYRRSNSRVTFSKEIFMNKKMFFIHDKTSTNQSVFCSYFSSGMNFHRITIVS